LKVTADGFGPLQTTVLAQPFNSLFEMSAESPPQGSKAIVYVVDDDLSVRMHDKLRSWRARES
jgi:hypothetical protein